MAFGNKTVTNTATLIVGANRERIGLVIVNNGTETIFLGQDNTVTTLNGTPVLQGANMTEQNGGAGTEMYYGPVYAIAATGPVNVRYWERMH